MMQTAIGNIIGILADNLAKRKTVMPMSAQKATAWAKGLNIPRGGECVLYTGHMYQMMPSIAAMQKNMERIRGTWMEKTMGLGRIANRFINTSWFISHADAKQQEIYNRRLRNIALLLQKAKVHFGYLYEKEMYAGALVCDLGGKDAFEAHARHVYTNLKKLGVKSIITVDPHTTDMLRDVYREIIPEYDIEVKSYLEVLAEAGLPENQNLKRSIALHDSCVYARYVNILEEPRKLLKGSGATVEEPEQSGQFTQCCGGPVEALYPEKASDFAKERLNQLKSTGCKEIAAMCPICLQNLEHAAKDAGVTVRDISEYLNEAYCADAS